ncbi:hypothetical protein [Hydrogenivirga sp. 128-5-R1-1]|uniref:hypothetical protein n=1 Tax=Hydrogenivirga sp. 128-5-R1-1 TaxID=392423 RepID=UPI00015F333F|nr:hypothetical protein [Hydrogenivirga sp. 128-5-R1-1]EDP74818.1 hypothetical protein HG1285_13157 [Hydrogenivirga sp. 128-5-R1-1]
MKGTQIFSPYELVIREIEEGSLDPFDIDLGYLITLFRKEAEDLKEWEYFEEAGRFLEASTKLIKLQVEDIFPSPKPERKKITIKEVREALVEDQDNYEPEYDLSWLWEHEVKVGRPAGSRDRQERKLTWKEFWSQAENISLHKETNYHELARKVRERIKEGEFKIRNIRDFIAYLFAYYEFQDVPEITTGAWSVIYE